MRGTDDPIPTARDPRKCRNLEDVMQWVRHRQAPVPSSGKVTIPKDGSVEEIVPILPDEDGKAIPGQ